METREIILPEGWEIDKVENNKIILKESKKELPKTWEECANILSVGTVEYIDEHSGIVPVYSSDIIPINDKNILPTGLSKPMLALCQLLVCREVYRQGWKPNWLHIEVKHCIGVSSNKIYSGPSVSCNFILSFQTGEIRDKFLENFKDLIEEAKELI